MSFRSQGSIQRARRLPLQGLQVKPEEQLTLSPDGFHGCGTFFIIVNHLVDASAHGIRTHVPSIEGFNSSEIKLASVTPGSSHKS